MGGAESAQLELGTAAPVSSMHVRVRRRVPPPHGALQSDHDDVRHAYAWQAAASHACAVAGIGRPAHRELSTTAVPSKHRTVRVCVPVPHIAEHVDHDEVSHS